MKILVLNYEYPPIGGGGGVISKYIAEILASREHDITVLSTWFHSLEEVEYKLNLRIIRVKSKRRSSFKSNPLEMLSWIKESRHVLDKLLEVESFGLTLANFVLPGGEVAYYLKRKYKIPYVVLSHGHDIPWVKPYGKLVPLHAISYTRLKKICLSSERNFIQSPEMQVNIDQFLGPKASSKNRLIPNGVDTDLFRADKREFKKLNIIFVGRLVTQKDPLTMLKAVRKFRKNNDDFNLSVYGDGPLRKEIEKYVASHDLENHVTFYGKVDNEHLVNAYKRAHLMVAPSVSEGMSISIMEALSCGIYVIATKVSGNSQLISPEINGEFMKIGKATDLFKSMDNYYNSKFRFKYEVPKDCLENFRTSFDWNVIVSKYEQELETVIGN